MNDNASATLGGTRTGFGGLPQRLVQDGVVDEGAMLEAVNTARERKTSVVTQLVASGAAAARDIAVAASNEYGVPLFDIEAVNLDLEVVRLVSLVRHARRQAAVPHRASLGAEVRWDSRRARFAEGRRTAGGELLDGLTFDQDRSPYHSHPHPRAIAFTRPAVT